MKLIQITDTHLMPPGGRIAGRDPRATLDAALADILARHGDADLVVLTGDLSENGLAEDYAHLSARLAEAGLPVALTIGNHDDRGLFLAAFPQAGDPDGHAQSVHALPEGRALVLDTVTGGSHAGSFCETRAAWAEAQLAAHPGPWFVFLHHNPIPTHLPMLDRIGLLDEGRLAGLLARHRARIAHVFHGHVHLPMTGSLHGIPISATRGTAHAGFPNYGSDKLLAASDLPESYAVIHTAGPAVTVMMVEYGYLMRAG